MPIAREGLGGAEGVEIESGLHQQIWDKQVCQGSFGTGSKFRLVTLVSYRLCEQLENKEVST